MGEEEDESGRRWSVSFGVTVRTMMADEDKRELRCVTVRTMRTRADVEADVAVAGQPQKKRTFKKFSFRGVDLDALLDMSTDDLVKLFTARARRSYSSRRRKLPLDLNPHLYAPWPFSLKHASQLVCSMR
ncbi:40s ribosomal protein s15 [Quercus suber]|uniref:40s ribosomal protein s15 n=1 Tax=Quercus suber TaxID=58331 RepID=A0AAW0K0D3_QUESU